MSKETNEFFTIENLVAGYGKIPIIHDISLEISQKSIFKFITL